MSGNTGLIVLAAGKGTRMKSRHPKVLHEAGGRSLLQHALAAAIGAGFSPADILVVIGHAAGAVRARAEAAGARCVVQQPQLGSGDAVRAARKPAEAYARVLVINGDMPLVSSRTLRALCDLLEAGAAAALATAEPAESRPYGRILRDPATGRVLAIVEDQVASPEQKAIRELNAGFYGFETARLWPALAAIGADNPHGEYYLTDVIAQLSRSGAEIAGYRLPDPEEILGINTRQELAQADSLLRRREARRLMEAGVTIYAPESVRIDAGVLVGEDTVLEAGVELRGRCRIGSGCRIGAGSLLTDMELGEDVEVLPYSVLNAATAESGARIGPFTRLREGAHVGAGAHVGNFVELKKARLGAGSKAMHLAYLGDAEIGADSNIGAGTITCNYDGRAKHATRIGDDCFIGSNSTLVAPLEIGARAYIGAGSVITEKVAPEALALGRSRQVEKPGWRRRRDKIAANRGG